MRLLALAVVLAASLVLASCASWAPPISPDREDFALVEGLHSTDWDCGTVPRRGGGYFYVCDMSIDVRRVVYGRAPERPVAARFFAFELDGEDEIITGPHMRRDRRAAAIFWRNDNGAGSFVLMEFPGRWCVPQWMLGEFSLSPEEVARLAREGYPQCDTSPSASD